MEGVYRVNNTEHPFFLMDITPKINTLEMTTSNMSVHSLTTRLPEPSPLLNQLQLTRFFVMRILVPVILTIGVTGNLLSIAVLTRRWMRSSTNYYLTILAVYDVLYLIFAFTLIIKHYTDVTGMKWYNYYKYHVGVPVADTCSNTGVWLTLTFTIERYIGVCHPMKGKALCTPERAKYIIIVVCAVAATITIPGFFANTVASSVECIEGENMTVYGGVTTDFAKHVSFRFGYKYVLQVLFTFLPLILLMVFNSLLIRAVMIAARQRKSMVQLAVVQSERQVRHNRDQHRITVMLITVVIVFLLCQTPQAIQNILINYYSHNAQLSEERKLLFTITANVFNLFVMINSSVNFVLYSAFSTKFRRTFSRLFCRCIKKKTPGEILFSEGAGATAHSSPADESRKHLLHGARKPPVTYNWPRDNQQGQANSKGNATRADNCHGYANNGHPKKNGYLGVKQNVQNIVSSV